MQFPVLSRRVTDESVRLRSLRSPSKLRYTNLHIHLRILSVGITLMDCGYVVHWCNKSGNRHMTRQISVLATCMPRSTRIGVPCDPEFYTEEDHRCSMENVEFCTSVACIHVAPSQSAGLSRLQFSYCQSRQYERNMRQVQCLVEFITLWYGGRSLPAMIAPVSIRCGFVAQQIEPMEFEP